MLEVLLIARLTCHTGNKRKILAENIVIIMATKTS